MKRLRPRAPSRSPISKTSAAACIAAYSAKDGLSADFVLVAVADVGNSVQVIHVKDCGDVSKRLRIVLLPCARCCASMICTIWLFSGLGAGISINQAFKVPIEI